MSIIPFEEFWPEHAGHDVQEICAATVWLKVTTLDIDTTYADDEWTVNNNEGDEQDMIEFDETEKYYCYTCSVELPWSRDPKEIKEAKRVADGETEVGEDDLDLV